MRGRSLQELRDLILGAPGSNISLTFMRDSTPNGPARTPELFHVHLMRGSPQFLASMSVAAAPSPAYAATPAPAASSTPAVTTSPPVQTSPEQSFAIPIPVDAFVTPPAPAPAPAPQQPMSQGLPPPLTFPTATRSHLFQDLATKSARV